MKRTVIKQGNHHLTPSLSASLLILLLVSGFFAGGCTDNITKTPQPLFALDIDLPTGKSTSAELTVQPGTRVVLPVTIRSTRNENLEVKLSISQEKEFPEAISISLQVGYFPVLSGDSVTTDIIYTIGENVAPGLYHTHLTGSIKEPIKGLAGIARAIDIIVTEKP